MQMRLGGWIWLSGWEQENGKLGIHEIVWRCMQMRWVTDNPICIRPPPKPGSRSRPQQFWTGRLAQARPEHAPIERVHPAQDAGSQPVTVDPMGVTWPFHGGPNWDLCLCVCVCVSVRVCVCMCNYMYICMCMYMYVHIYMQCIWMHVYLYICICVCICMCIYVSVCICIYMYICLYIYMYMHMFMYMYVWVIVCVYVWCVYVYAYACVRVSACICVYVCVCLRVFVCVHIWMYILCHFFRSDINPTVCTCVLQHTPDISNNFPEYMTLELCTGSHLWSIHSPIMF